jgi:hypothetical protein
MSAPESAARKSFLARLDEIEAEKHRSRAKRMEELMPEIVGALERGITRDMILKALQLEGIDVTLSTLSNYVRRYRKQLEDADLRPQIPAEDSSAGAPEPKDPATP